MVVISNQAGVARGYFPEYLVNQVNDRMIELLAAEGAKLDGIYYCPHHPHAEEPMYRRNCECRKPRPGLLHKAAIELELDLKKSFVVGDRVTDLKLARQVGATAIMVLTGYGRGENEYVLPDKKVKSDLVAEDLGAAVDWILEQLSLE